ncbi:hypothetical protein [Rickettsia endosymbiont of Gonocerus acuteangulatus]|uniref:hypothetical protein n=1 Tax=Rickettsia endosymbiont of Gonocerus acuteangulatus TaxID=3066266 RepID=UPI003132FA92
MKFIITLVGISSSLSKNNLPMIKVTVVIIDGIKKERELPLRPIIPAIKGIVKINATISDAIFIPLAKSTIPAYCILGKTLFTDAVNTAITPSPNVI